MKKKRKYKIIVYDYYGNEDYKELLKDKIFYTVKQAKWWLMCKSGIDSYKHYIIYKVDKEEYI